MIDLKARREFIKANAGKMSVKDMALELGTHRRDVYYDARCMKISLELESDKERRRVADEFIKANIGKMKFPAMARALNEPPMFIYNRIKYLKLVQPKEELNFDRNGIFDEREYAKVATI